jgi:4-hydroxy-tetrahydrodipicolinate synthase
VSAPIDRLTGTWFVLPTPFDGDGRLDRTSLARLVDATIVWEVDGLTTMGVTAEPGALSAAERSEALRTIAETVRGRVPFVVGCSAGSVEAVAELVGQAHELGAAAAMVSAPPLWRAVTALPAFWRSVAERSPIPVVLQDEPAATGVVIPVDVLADCVRSSSIRVVKLEDPPTPPKLTALLDTAPGLQVFGGLGGAFALSELRRGACGTMTGFAFPEILGAVRRSTGAGDHTRAGEIFDRYLPLIQFEAQAGVGLAIRKELLRRRGVLATHATRGVVRSLDERTLREVDDVLARVGIEPGPGRMEVD